MNNIKYILYARKSTDEEDRPVRSIKAQLHELKEFAAKEKLEIVKGRNGSVRNFWGQPRRRRRRNGFELDSVYPAA